jgi:hypothetical protein
MSKLPPLVELHVHFDGAWDEASLWGEVGKIRAADAWESLPAEAHTPWDGGTMPVREAIKSCT